METEESTSIGQKIGCDDPVPIFEPLQGIGDRNKRRADNRGLERRQKETEAKPRTLHFSHSHRNHVGKGSPKCQGIQSPALQVLCIYCIVALRGWIIDGWNLKRRIR